MEIKMKLEATDNLKKCDNAKLPEYLKDLTEGDHVIFKSPEELKADGVPETNPLHYLVGKGFIVQRSTISAIESDEETISQITISPKVRQLLSDNGYKGEELKDGEFINIRLCDIKYPCAKVAPEKKPVISLREKAKDEINDDLIKEMISKVDKETLKKQFQIPISIGRKPMVVPDAILDMYLDKWARAKAEYYLAFDRNLTVSKKIEYNMEENEMSVLLNELIRKYPKYALNIVRIPAKNFVENKMPEVNDFRMYFGDDYVKGMKVSKFISMFNDKEFDDDVSAVMQERIVKGFLTLSIDPYDYMTHAISMHGWGSCHSPVSQCYPTSSFMYMIDQGTVIAYKHNGKEYTYDKGMYRDVDSPRTFDFKKNSFKGNSKSYRQLIAVDKDTTTMIFSREYPKRTSSDDLRTQVREMFEEVLAKYLGIENTWANYGDDLRKYKATHTEHYYSDVSNYRSLCQSYPGTVKMDYVAVKDSDISKSAVVDGEKIYCLNCGKELTGKSLLCNSCMSV